MPASPAHGAALNRDAVVAWYRRNRERSRAIFDLIADQWIDSVDGFAMTLVEAV